jgi:hypothetical protein
LAGFGAFAAAEVIFAEGKLGRDLEEALLEVVEIPAALFRLCEGGGPAVVL